MARDFIFSFDLIMKWNDLWIINSSHPNTIKLHLVSIIKTFKTLDLDMNPSFFPAKIIFY